jgi:hypothetical protein
MQLNAKWTNDCQGKKDFDGDIVSISTRYWPRGGGMMILNVDQNGAHWLPPDESIRPHAHSSLLVRHDESEPLMLIERHFEGETFEEIALQVEAWAQEQMDRAVAALLTEFDSHPCP